VIKGYYAFQSIERNIELREQGRVLLWTHLGLGDQISAARIVESYLASGTEVIWPVKTRNIDFMKIAYGRLPGLELIEVPDFNKHEWSLVRRISKANRVKIVVAGHSLLRPLSEAFPELPLNSLFNLSVGIHPMDLVSPDLRERLGTSQQAPIPSVPFAFVDHHPGTPREIPLEVLSGVSSRGLLIFNNPRFLNLTKVVSLMDAADELHLVASAPLCLALTIGARAKVKVHYDSLGDPIANSYEGWSSVPISEIKTPRELLRANQNQAKFRSKVKGLIKGF
jgi:hypothetical protein